MDTEYNRIISSRKIYELLALIRQRPYLFLTTKSIVALQNFINGYMQLGFADDIYHPGEPNFDEFKNWILSLYENESEIRNPYTKLFLRLCDGDEEKAFDKFFEYLDEFKTQLQQS